MKLQLVVGLRIRAIRKRRGLTQEQLAERIERSPDAISQLERGISLPSFDTIERLAAALDVPVADFFDTGGRDADISPQRERLRASLWASINDLSDDQLRQLVTIVEALWTDNRP